MLLGDEKWRILYPACKKQLAFSQGVENKTGITRSPLWN